jgi:hypothetical protein
MDEDGPLVPDEALSLPDSSTLTGPEQVARHPAPTVVEPAEELLMSHAIGLEAPAVIGCKTPVRVLSLFWTCLAYGSTIFPVRVNPFSL